MYLIDFLDDKDFIVEFDRFCLFRGFVGLFFIELWVGVKLCVDNYNIGGVCY